MPSKTYICVVVDSSQMLEYKPCTTGFVVILLIVCQNYFETNIVVLLHVHCTQYWSMYLYLVLDCPLLLSAETGYFISFLDVTSFF